jgi:hypothetical protein
VNFELLQRRQANLRVGVEFDRAVSLQLVETGVGPSNCPPVVGVAVPGEYATVTQAVQVVEHLPLADVDWGCAAISAVVPPLSSASALTTDCIPSLQVLSTRASPATGTQSGSVSVWTHTTAPFPSRPNRMAA